MIDFYLLQDELTYTSLEVQCSCHSKIPYRKIYWFKEQLKHNDFQINTEDTINLKYTFWRWF